MGHQQLYWSQLGSFGQGSGSCRICHGLIWKYGLNMCRRCSRQYAKDIGFITLD
ncbi:small ribosomal subunit protein uS14-like [Myotis daubentonii]|uniref:small ribosomal subunit protein uS14-like n=1 Tax=Myotis daubentonii TaxID=98922 RepID=UPI002872B480|nr:small ribosomal subunit protein uS14-like [Myotis daubentonii]